MKTSKITGAIGVLALLGSSMAMAAQVVVVNPSTTTPDSSINEVFTVTLQMTGGANIGGGTFTVNWDDTTASLDSYSLPAIGDGPVAIGTGSFLLLNNNTFDLLPGAPPISGTFNFAVLTFTALSAGPMNLLVADDGGIASGWFDNDTADPIPTSYTNADIQVQGVPAPAAVWLLGTGIAGLIVRKARQVRASA